MDAIWQRHKGFIVQLLIGGILFLVAFFVMRNIYGDSNDPAKASAENAKKRDSLQAKLDAGHAPTADEITAQREVADRAEKLKWEIARRVASVAGLEGKKSDADRDNDYAIENINLVLKNIGRPDDGYVADYGKFRQTCISRLRDAARTVLVSRAAQSGKELDESLGLTSGFPDEEIPEALHGLAIATDVVGRCLARPGIDKVQSIRISSTSRFPEEAGISFMSAMGVHIEIVGNPADILEVIRSFQAAGQKDQRMTVVESIEYIVPISPDEDTVKTAINLVGLRYKAEKQAEGR